MLTPSPDLPREQRAGGEHHGRRRRRDPPVLPLPREPAVRAEPVGAVRDEAPHAVGQRRGAVRQRVDRAGLDGAAAGLRAVGGEWGPAGGGGHGERGDRAGGCAGLGSDWERGGGSDAGHVARRWVGRGRSRGLTDQGRSQSFRDEASRGCVLKSSSDLDGVFSVFVDGCIGACV